MRFRLPLMLRRTHQAAIDAQLRRHHVHVGDLHDKLNFAAKERKALEAEVVSLRADLAEAVAARDKADDLVAMFRSAVESFDEDYNQLEAQLASLGHREPFDWAYPAPPTLNTIVTANIDGVRGAFGGMGGDPDGDDPRFNLDLSYGLAPC
jgi:hypothetical protein